MAEEEANIAMSKSIQVTTASFLVNMSKVDLENLLNGNEYVDDFEIEELDKEDRRKEVFVVFKNPIDLKYFSNVVLQEIFNK